MSDTLAVEQAIALLPQREPGEDGRSLIHTQVESGLALLGADWDQEDVLALLERAEAIYPTTGMARRMGKALVAYERREDGSVRRVFVEGDCGKEEPA